MHPGSSRALVGVLLLAVAAGAAAQRVYRSVGPDGKVIFSDQPPVDRDAVLLQSGRAPERAASAASAASAAAPASSAAERAARDARVRQAKKASQAGEAAPAAAAPEGPSPAAVQAVGRALGVLTNTELLVQDFEKTCVSTLPTSMKRYAGAADTWRERHAPLLAKRDFALTQSPAERRTAVMDESRSFVQRMMQPVHQGNMAQRIKWCDRSAQEIVAGSLDRHRDPSVTEPMGLIQAR